MSCAARYGECFASKSSLQYLIYVMIELIWAVPVCVRAPAVSSG
jgi:hypothetical protein